MQDGPVLMAKDAETNNYTFPYLYDETQDVAKARFYGTAVDCFEVLYRVSMLSKC